MKSDDSIHNICIAAIKRSTMKPYDFKWTKFYETDSRILFRDFPFELDEKELIICSTIIDSNNFSVLTSRKLITKENAIISVGSLINAEDGMYGEFKSRNDEFTFGSVYLENNEHLKYIIETGKASMIMIHGVRTAVRIQKMTAIQIKKVTDIWNHKLINS